MLTRRSMMLASIAAGAMINTRTAAAKAAQPATPVNFDIPAGACDCHTHIHPDPARSSPAASTPRNWRRLKR